MHLLKPKSFTCSQYQAFQGWMSRPSINVFSHICFQSTNHHTEPSHSLKSQHGRQISYRSNSMVALGAEWKSQPLVQNIVRTPRPPFPSTPLAADIRHLRHSPRGQRGSSLTRSARRRDGRCNLRQQFLKQQDKRKSLSGSWCSVLDVLGGAAPALTQSLKLKSTQTPRFVEERAAV